MRLRAGLSLSALAPLVAALAACGGDPAPSIPIARDAPWPKFRADARQTGRGRAHASATGGALWTFPTGKGIFSSPVVAADGTIYVGSADRTFYAIHKDGTLRWKHLTGEIIDSAALLDDQGRVYVASGDGHLYAFDATTGDVAWTFAADAPGPHSLINWFEGNVAIGPDGTLIAGNDNFHVYGIHRDGTEAWKTDMPDQTWSSPAVDAATGQLYLGNNAMLTFLGANLWSFDRAGQRVWKHGATGGSIAASPLLTTDGAVIVGAFDGYVRSIDTATNQERWSFATRDHVYASAAELPDGTVVVPDPAAGAQRWAFDTLEPIRSSPAVDADGNIYVGSGEGRLFVLNPDGTLRWAMRLISDLRNDLNASPALGDDAVYLAGETGEIFSVPYDYCLHDAGMADARCTRGPGEDLPADAAALWMTTPLGAPLATPPATLDGNQPLTLSLIVRQHQDTTLAVLDSASVKVTVDPATPVDVEVAADRRFVVVSPTTGFVGDAAGNVTVHVTGQYLVDPARDGLKLTGGRPGGALDQTFHFAIAPATATPFAITAPAALGDAATAFEIYRLAAPLPTLLPSYNQIGFDSLHYLAGVVEGAGDHDVAWVVGGKLDDQNHTVVDPATKGVFALDIAYTGGAATFTNDAGFSLEAMGATLTFRKFRVSARLDASGGATGSPSFVVSTQCRDIPIYGPFLGDLGLCNPDTDTLLVSGATLLRPYAGGTGPTAAALGTVAFTVDAGVVRATLTGSSIKPAEHALGVLLVDAATGHPLSLDYGLATQRTANPDGTAATVEIATPAGTTGSVRAYLMVDTYPAARATVTL